METPISQRCHGLTRARQPCKRTGYAPPSTKFMCDPHRHQSPRAVDTDPTPSRGEVKCFATTKRGLRCNNAGCGDRTLYEHHFPYGVYLCPSHYKTLTRVKSASEIDQLISAHVQDMATMSIDSSDSESDASSRAEMEIDQHFNLSQLRFSRMVPPMPRNVVRYREAAASPHKIATSRYRNRQSTIHEAKELLVSSVNGKVSGPEANSLTPPTQNSSSKLSEPGNALQILYLNPKPIRCVGGLTQNRSSRCNQSKITDGVYRCPNHLNSGLEYQRCPGITKSGHRCVRLGIPQSGTTFQCHQHTFVGGQ